MIKAFHGLKNNQKAAIVAVFLSLSFALMGVWVRMASDSFDDFQQSYLRILGAGIIAFVFFRRYFRKNLFRSVTKHEWKIFVSRAIICYVFGTAFFTIAINNANLGAVAFISALPILGLIAFIMFREKLPLASIPFLLLSALGLVLVTGVTLGDFNFGIGEWAAIISMVGFNIGFLMTRFHSKERSNFENTTILLLIGWIPIFIISLLLRENILPTSLSITSLVGLFLGAVFNTINLFGSNYIFKHLKAYVAGNILLLETVWASMLGLTLFAEPITMMVAAGGMLIIASAFAVNKIDKKDEERLIS